MGFPPLRISFFLFLATACSQGAAEGNPPGDGGSPADRAWQDVFTDLPGALISLWGKSRSDVWAVGSDTGDGRGALVLHFDGATWVRRALGSQTDLWWVHGFSDDSVMFAGSGGTVIHASGGRYRQMGTPSATGTVFGLWGSSAQDVWAVGGDLTSGTGAFVWHYDGLTWTNVEMPTGGREVGAFFKVWGTAADDVWIVGTEGALLHFDGASWSVVETSTAEPFFTVHAVGGQSASAAAVGGYDLAVAIERGAAGAWEPALLPPGTRQLFGVWLTASGGGYAVGADAAILRREGGTWASVETGLETNKPLHAVWMDEDEGVWAVGGDVIVPPLGEGVLVHYGQPLPTVYAEETLALEWLDGGSSEQPPTADASSDASVSLPEGGIDASGDAARDAYGDAGTPNAPDGPVETGVPPIVFTPGSVACGGDTCAVGTEVCCRPRSSNDVPVCVNSQEACPAGFFSMQCDQRDDCAPAEICCLTVFFQGGGIASVACATDCFGHALCGDAAECGGASCSSLSVLPELNECL